MRLLNDHIAFLLAEAIHPATFTLMCFTETASNGAKFGDTNSYENNYKSFHKFTGHGLAIYQTSKISSVEKFPIISSI